MEVTVKNTDPQHYFVEAFTPNIHNRWLENKKALNHDSQDSFIDDSVIGARFDDFMTIRV